MARVRSGRLRGKRSWHEHGGVNKRSENDLLATPSFLTFETKAGLTIGT